MISRMNLFRCLGALWLSLIFLVATASAETVTYYYTNQQGTPLATADASGNLLTTADYRPYGVQALGMAQQGPGYTGHVSDAASGLVYMQARYYDPSVGRFISADPSAGGGFSRYAYANGNPVVNFDPDGRQAFAGWPDSQVHLPQASAERFTSIVLTSLPIIGDAANIVDAVQDPGIVNVSIAVIGLVPEGGSMAAGALRETRAARLATNIAKGRAGEAATRAKLGEKVAGEQVTIKASDGTRTRVDFVTKDGGVVETKTGNATLSNGQSKLMDDVAAGRQVTPVGRNAEDAGLKPGQPTTIKSCNVDRQC